LKQHTCNCVPPDGPIADAGVDGARELDVGFTGASVNAE